MGKNSHDRDFSKNSPKTRFKYQVFGDYFQETVLREFLAASHGGEPASRAISRKRPFSGDAFLEEIRLLLVYSGCKCCNYIR
jgi:hypothetical protein